MVGALHGAVLGNIRADQGFHTQVCHFFTEIHGLFLALLRPALDGNVAVPDVDAHGDFLAVFGNGCIQKIRVCDGGGAQNHPVDAGA